MYCIDYQIYFDRWCQGFGVSADQAELLHLISCLVSNSEDYVCIYPPPLHLTDRVMIWLEDKDHFFLEIQKPADAGTYSQVQHKDNLMDFLENIESIVLMPEKFGFDYEGW